MPPSADLLAEMFIGWHELRSPACLFLASHTATRSPFGAVHSAGMRYTATPPSPAFHRHVVPAAAADS